MGEYHVDSAPTLVVNGRFVTSPAQAASRLADQSPAAANKAVLTVLDTLVAKARAENGAAKK
jgi:thiol:disulfide interchange protein DsbA